MYPSIHLYIYSIHLSIYLSIYLSIHPSIHPSIFLSIYLSIHLSARLKTKLFCETSSIFELDNIKNAAILQDFLNVDLDNIKHEGILRDFPKGKNEAILRDFLQKWSVECRADGLVPMRFAILPLHLSRVLRLPRKSDAKSYEVLHLSRKIILANLKI